MLRVIRWTAIGLVVILAGIWAGVWWRGQGGSNPIAGIAMPGSVTVGGPFTLVDPSGKTVTDADFRGRWMLVYFGYTFCPDVCPTELQAMAASLDKLGSQATKLVPIFITVDPDRDTPSVMGDYVKLFDDRLVGLSGSPAQVAAALRAYRVYAVKSESKTTTSYLMDHSSFLYLMGPDGKLRTLFKPGTSSDEIAASIRAKMSES
jgi:cytochrome oxidase Cu insertion factor (SCO1/SenC/PrrC family)